jgi:hypothetical protein
MPEIIYSTKTKINGPLLLDHSSLLAVDKIMTEQKPVLEELRSQLIDQSVAQRMSELKEENADVSEEQEKLVRESLERRAAEYSTALTLYLANGSRLRAKSFGEAVAHSEFSDVPASGFGLSLSCGALSMTLNSDSDLFSTNMSLVVSPSNAEGATNLFTEMRRWVRTVQAPLWQQWWCRLGHLRFIVWLAWSFLVLMVTLYAIGLDDSYYKRQARDLVHEGINQSNQQKAIQTILAIQADVAGPTQRNLGHRYWFFLLGSLAVCLMLTYPPKFVLGLGSGEDKIKRWRAWTKFVFVSIPGFVASSFLWPYVSDVLKRWW